ncbi:MAG: flagellar motor protein MotB [Acidobacteria bacterium RIFCSPLOWO2_12_FULL_60_22]|nr:MAG: flagellar motor protein MotB [Acidobacteria bacterium RIFCSPLOWO2_12_FULL_60_22]
MILAIASLLFVVSSAGAAQELGSVGQAQFRQGDSTPIYKITIVERTAKAINYRHRNGATKIDFSGTPLMPAARGEAKVESKQGYIEIEVEFDDLQSATRFGPEFLTYVMWAITPEGRATNLGEIILNGTKSKLNVTTEFQAFGLIVTAEPYFAVAQPSNVVVMENIIRKDTVGKIEEIEAKYELLERGQYTLNVLPADLQPMKLDKKTPLDLYEARNAVRIARWAGADVSAAESFQKATKLLEQAENYKTRKAGSKPIAMTAREAVQTAEDARLIARKRQGEERLEQERAASADREALANLATDRAQAEADAAARGRAQAEEIQRLESERRARAEAESAAAQAQAARTKMEAELAADRAARDKEAAQSESERALKTAAEQAEQARKTTAEQAEREKQELRDKLVTQLNLVLETRDSARGLIVNMSDVLFDTGKHTLRPVAREKLAKLSGIVLAYPTLNLEVEGHTDSVGTDEYNMQLSEMRANAVRDYLIHEGINSSSVAARGFGEGQAVATNDTAAGRQENRRVELVVSGEVIGTQIGITTGAKLQR